ncbi:hypothetical protein M406DRAFT_358146 [Cryphonectria parasitica EP155]|uniref:Uncharacterized protein n=1 Tax=Cryphonectria parasitica (strain ATCC 38755 / EP155) TaxID=660469 RepID=A0A9P5CL70_CRYP1|nr:uncharacterized protein M406DRAFT_358146 [Cryphonectria parasitica EP155]KAF3761927.1 hypothetical protein M406DRAFT_358146 [Cryphonectria parasitica EP155]
MVTYLGGAINLLASSESTRLDAGVGDGAYKTARNCGRIEDARMPKIFKIQFS